jgi:hypothetical protein
MQNKLVCTICSKEKRDDKKLLPAINRYISKRIDKVSKIADESGLQFAILSGEYGLLMPDENIPFYDHLLKMNEVKSLSEVAKKQLSDMGTTEIIFYAKPREDNWKPYYLVLENATKNLGIKLDVKLI